MAHIGEELRLVLAGLFKLSALVLDFVEEPYVLDRNRSLVGKGCDQLDLLFGERPHLGTAQGKSTDRHALAQHRNTEVGTKMAKSLRLGPGILRISLHVGNMNDFAFK